MSSTMFEKLTKTEKVDFLFERYGIPKGKSRGMNKDRLLIEYLDAARNEETHAAIARQASKAKVLGTPFPDDDPRMQDLNDDSPQDESEV